jgi:hypothetical protein
MAKFLTLTISTAFQASANIPTSPSLAAVNSLFFFFTIAFYSFLHGTIPTGTVVAKCGAFMLAAVLKLVTNLTTGSIGVTARLIDGSNPAETRLGAAQRLAWGAWTLMACFWAEMGAILSSFLIANIFAGVRLAIRREFWVPGLPAIAIVFWHPSNCVDKVTVRACEGEILEFFDFLCIFDVVLFLDPLLDATQVALDVAPTAVPDRAFDIDFGQADQAVSCRAFWLFPDLSAAFIMSSLMGMAILFAGPFIIFPWLFGIIISVLVILVISGSFGTTLVIGFPIPPQALISELRIISQRSSNLPQAIWPFPCVIIGRSIWAIMAIFDFLGKWLAAPGRTTVTPTGPAVIIIIAVFVILISIPSGEFLVTAGSAGMEWL